MVAPYIHTYIPSKWKYVFSIFHGFIFKIIRKIFYREELEKFQAKVEVASGDKFKLTMANELVISITLNYERT